MFYLVDYFFISPVAPCSAGFPVVDLTVIFSQQLPIPSSRLPSIFYSGAHLNYSEKSLQNLKGR